MMKYPNDIYKFIGESIEEGKPATRNEIAEKFGLSYDSAKNYRFRVLKAYPELKKKYNKLMGIVPEGTTAKLEAENRALQKKLQEKEVSQSEIDNEIEMRKILMEKNEAEKKVKNLQDMVIKLQNRNSLLLNINDSKITPINLQIDMKQHNQATAFAILSDWHVDEIVRPSKIHNKNEYTANEAEIRVSLLAQNIVKLINIHKEHLHISQIVVALLGDFITGVVAHGCELSMPPMKAAIFAQQLIESVIEYILKNTDLKIIVPCSFGNHSRITEYTIVSEVAGNSLEYMIYHTIANKFANNDQIQFIIDENVNTYVDVYGTKFRFSHGDDIKYGGGVGGIDVPVRRAIMQKNLTEHADYDVMGHWHQLRNLGHIIINGSLIGYNSFADWCKFRFEKPRQAFFLYNKEDDIFGYNPIRLHTKRNLLD